MRTITFLNIFKLRKPFFKQNLSISRLRKTTRTVNNQFYTGRIRVLKLKNLICGFYFSHQISNLSPLGPSARGFPEKNLAASSRAAYWKKATKNKTLCI